MQRTAYASAVAATPWLPSVTGAVENRPVLRSSGCRAEAFGLIETTTVFFLHPHNSTTHDSPESPPKPRLPRPVLVKSAAVLRSVRVMQGLERKVLGRVVAALSRFVMSLLLK